ncbi:MAG: helix-turn-helix domain-containing protein [Armatimonadetes bacterium]|nr:helix-turn-helix domain-containing protein [Armatimonadota bacterium]
MSEIEKLLTPEDISAACGVSKPTVMGWIHEEDPEKRLPSSRLGVRIFIKPEDFSAWLDRNRTRGKAACRSVRHGNKAQATES